MFDLVSGMNNKNEQCSLTGFVYKPTPNGIFNTILFITADVFCSCMTCTYSTCRFINLVG